MVTRWLRLVMAIQGGRAYSVKELAQRTGVSTRTIFRDLGGMQEAGVPIYFDDAAGGYRLTENFQMRPLQLSSDDLNTLVGALSFMRRTLPLRSRKNVDAVMDKLLSGLPVRQREEAGALDRTLVIDPLGGARGLEDERVVQALEQALSQRRKVHMRYAAFAHGGEESERTVRPYGLVYRGTSLYLVGFCESRQDIRTFRVGRVRALTVLDAGYAMPADFDLNSYLTGLWGITEGPETEVRLRFCKPVAQLALETRWHPSQSNQPQPDGSVLVTMTTRGPAELSRWLAGYGGHVIVEEPASLRDEVLRLARGVLVAHQDSTAQNDKRTGV